MASVEKALSSQAMTPSNTAPALSTLLVHASAIVRGVQRGQSPTAKLDQMPAQIRAGVQSIAFTTLRRLGVAQALRQRLVSRSPPPDIDALLCVALALAQLSVDATPQPGEDDRGDGNARYAMHVLVDQAVKAAHTVKPALAGFVNAVLRRYLRESAQWALRLRADPVAHHNHPAWWIERLQRDWPGKYEALLHQSRRAPPMTLRADLRVASPEEHAARLLDAGHPALCPAWSRATQAMFKLQRPCPVGALPGFADGALSVQDAAAQLAAPLVLQDLTLGAGARVLDACAAPGGKTAHLLQLDPSLQVTALDIDHDRLALVAATLKRTGTQACLIAGDAAQVASWWDGVAFDAVLLDAPCTASGIVRRHPDIPWLRHPDDIAALAKTQSSLLDALWPVVKPGGCLVYATCSLFKAEGSEQIDAFLQRTPGPRPLLDAASPGHLLPLPEVPPENSSLTPAAAHDGFFYARLIKPPLI
jgi:16S rRNA (cytosine967-C5)-methyltransferase